MAHGGTPRAESAWTRRSGFPPSGVRLRIGLPDYAKEYTCATTEHHPTQKILVRAQAVRVKVNFPCTSVGLWQRQRDRLMEPAEVRGASVHHEQLEHRHNVCLSRRGYECTLYGHDRRRYGLSSPPGQAGDVKARLLDTSDQAMCHAFALSWERAGPQSVQGANAQFPIRPA
ncbi:hypothetical protein BD310DRAFT_149903 [Dichomitus squalens]|uniref:Uncharacterized protein n=1 Tax=Dichomitus squalens TaxID=114155 RepID=A0A4V2K8Y8_9APHY|nr:hypothetical protein BD310DRAFT_149903 [Dichomitus squalens]